MEVTLHNVSNIKATARSEPSYRALTIKITHRPYPFNYEVIAELVLFTNSKEELNSIIDALGDIPHV